MERWPLVAAALLATCMVGRAYAGPPPLFPNCCACIAGDTQAQAGLPQPLPLPVLFCVELTDEEQSRTQALRCENLGGDLSCLGHDAAQTSDEAGSCVSVLAESGVVCPVPGAPTMGQSGLAALVGLLGTLGVVVLRRRATRTQ